MSKFFVAPHSKIASAAILAGLMAGAAVAQPDKPTTPDYLPSQGPGTTTAGLPPDAQGFTPLMDGSTFNGWWHSGQTNHSGGNPQGAIIKASPQEKAFYMTQRGRDGGILMTNQKYQNYELVFDYWSDFGNDGGIFHRTPANGQCIQTVLDYIGGASVGGIWGEGGFMDKDWRPFSYSGNENTIAIPGNNRGENSNWTTITRKIKEAGGEDADFDCPASGCTQAQYTALFDANGWNEYRLIFYGGTGAGAKVSLKSYFRKAGATKWVPILFDLGFNIPNNKTLPANYIGLQVHGGNRFGGPRGAWYRNIKIRTVDEVTGKPNTTSLSKSAPKSQLNLKTVSNTLLGSVDADHEIVVTDVTGKTVERFAGKSGNFSYAFKSEARGVLLVRVSSSHGVETHRVFRAL